MLTLTTARQPAPILARGAIGVGLSGGPSVTVWTAGAAAGLMGTAGTVGGVGATVSAGASVLAGTAMTTGAVAGLTTGSMLAAAAIGGAVGSIASQGVAMAMGMQDSFNWQGVGMSALGAGVSSGMGNYLSAGQAGATTQAAKQSISWGEAALRAGGASVATQGMGVMLGMSSFSWRGVAASAAGAGASSALGQTQWMQSAASAFGDQSGRVFAGTAAGLVNGGIQAGIFETKPNWGSIAAQSFGSAVGDSMVGSAVKADADRKSVRDENTEFSLSGARLGQSSRSGLRLGTGDAGDSVAFESESGRAWTADVSARRTNAANAWSADAPARTDVKVNPGSVYVQQGDNLTSVARRYMGDGATVGEVNAFKNQLAAANPQLGNLNAVQPGQELNLPGADTAVDGATMAKLSAADRQYIAQRTLVVPTAEEPALGFRDAQAVVASQRLEAGRRTYAEAWERAPSMTAGSGTGGLQATADTIDSIAANPLGAAGYLLGRALGTSERGAAILAAVGAVSGDLLALRAGTARRSSVESEVAALQRIGANARADGTGSLARMARINELSTIAANRQTVTDLGIPNRLSLRQDLHIPPVTDGRSVLTADPAELLQGLINGRYPVLRTPKPGQAVVDFGQPIGEFWSRQTGVPKLVGPTNYGSVLFGKNGTHIVPANPTQW